MHKNSISGFGPLLFGLCVALLLSTYAEAAPQEATKNVVRFVGSAVIAGGATVMLDKYTETEHPAIYGAAIGAVPSVLKEVADRHTVHGAQGSDLAIGFAGAAVGAIVANEALEVEPVDLASSFVSTAVGGVGGAAVGGAIQLAYKPKEARLSDIAVGIATAAIGGPQGLVIGLCWQLISAD